MLSQVSSDRGSSEVGFESFIAAEKELKDVCPCRDKND